MRIPKAAVCVASLLLISPAAARGQDEPLAGLLKRLLDQATINAPSPLPSGVIVRHEPHFIVGESLRLTTREVNVAIASQVASFPLPSSSGGFTFSVNDRGEVLPTSTNFGPLFAERAVTIGHRKVNFGFTFQQTTYDSFEGIDLESGDLRVIREHNDCCPGGVGIPTNPTNFTPDFERDLLRSRLSTTIDSRTTAFFVNYGVTERVDVSLAVPIVNVSLDARVDAEVLRTGSGDASTTHQFDASGARTASFSETGSSTGLGDMLVRGKFNFFNTGRTAMAGAIDLRLPTGDKDELLGTGATQTKLFAIASGEYGAFSPHVNFGYTFSAGETSEEATSFDLDPTAFALATVPGFDPQGVNLSVPDEINYTAGFSVAAGPYVTVGFDLHGRNMRDVARFELRSNSYPNRFPSGAGFTENDEFSLESADGNLNLLLGVIGGKINLGGTFLLNLTVLVPMTDAGLKPKPTPVIGFDYVF
jgi:hypothetical protein